VLNTAANSSEATFRKQRKASCCLRVKRAGEPSLIPYNIVSIEGEIPCLPSLRAASEDQVIVTSLSVVEL
jgi:hypothetical protein